MGREGEGEWRRRALDGKGIWGGKREGRRRALGCLDSLGERGARSGREECGCGLVVRN